MKIRIILSVGAIIAAACFSERGPTDVGQLDCSADLNDQVPGSTLVVISNFSFGPQEVRIRRGTSVTWVNCDDIGHTSTSDNGAWDSPLLDQGVTYTREFDQVGTFPYHCTPHPSMTARIIVE